HCDSELIPERAGYCAASTRRTKRFRRFRPENAHLLPTEPFRKSSLPYNSCKISFSTVGSLEARQSQLHTEAAGLRSCIERFLHLIRCSDFYRNFMNWHDERTHEK